jgi:hypothetical protein
VSPRTIRRLVLAVFVAGIAGMVVGSIADNSGMAVTFGLITAAAAVGLILVTAVGGPGAFGPPSRVRRTALPDPVPGDADRDEAGRAVEEQVDRLLAGGADERDVRELVRRAVRFGRSG